MRSDSDKAMVEATERISRSRGQRRSRDQRRGDGFTRDESMERLLELKAKDPDRFDKISTDIKVRLGFYTNAKESAERLDNAS